MPKFGNGHGKVSEMKDLPYMFVLNASIIQNEILATKMMIKYKRQSIVYTDFDCFKPEFHVFKSVFNAYSTRLNVQYFL